MLLILLLIFVIKSSLSITSIKTYPTVNLSENVPLNTKVVELNKEEKKIKLMLLNLVGYEINLFEIENEIIYTKNEIDREEFLSKKRCFDRLYCLIELHILVNDGEEYWVIPIHIIDENDNKPSFKNDLIELKMFENNLNEYKIPFEGAKDNDEGLNNQISYILDCSNKKELDLKLIIKENKTLINCFPLFDLILFSQSSLINQYDQLGIKYNCLTSYSNEYELILYGFNLNKIEFKNSMKIQIKIEKFLKKPEFLLSEYKFIIENEFLLRKGKKIGEVKIKKRNNLKEKLIYKILNQTINENIIEINSLTGELFILNEINLKNLNEINLLIKSFYLINSNISTNVNVKILIRLNLNETFQINYQLNHLFIQQILNQSNEFLIKKQNFSQNEILFHLSSLSLFYPSDQFLLSLFNFNQIFSLIYLNKQNNYLLKFNQNYQFNSNLLLIIQIKHQLTNKYLTNLTIQINTNILCLQNSIFHLFDFNQTNLLGKFQVIQTNLNVFSFSFSQFIFSKDQILFNQCQMLIINQQFNYLNLTQSQYQLCSLSLNQCFHISLNHSNRNIKSLFFNKIRTIRPLELIILILSFLFILLTIIFIFIICRFKAFHLCLTIKNYLFYGKKYGLNNAQRLSSNKITQRVHSIVVRESRSPSIEHIKSLQPYIFNLNQLVEQETIPTINLYSQSSSSSTPHISTSSLQRKQRSDDHQFNPQTSSSSPVLLQENKQQLLDIISSNDDFDLCRLASEV